MMMLMRKATLCTLVVVLCAIASRSSAFVNVPRRCITINSAPTHCPYTYAVSKASFKKKNKEIVNVVHGRQLFMTASISAVTTAVTNQSGNGKNTSAVTNQSDNGKNRLAAVCSFLAGWADVALFLRYKTFATMMTGNILWLAQALVEQRYRLVGYYASVIASYLIGLVVFRKTDLSLKQRTMPVSAALVTSLFVASEVLHYAGVPSIPVLLLALGFGIVNSVGTEVAGTLTFVITGHMTKLTHQLVDRLLSRKQKAIDSKAVIQNLTVLLGFFGGALWACFIHKVLRRQFHMEFAVLGISYGLLFLWQDMESLGGAWWLRKDKRMCELDDYGVLCQTAEELEEVDTSEASTSKSTIGAPLV